MRVASQGRTCRARQQLPRDVALNGLRFRERGVRASTRDAGEAGMRKLDESDGRVVEVIEDEVTWPVERTDVFVPRTRTETLKPEENEFVRRIGRALLQGAQG